MHPRAAGGRLWLVHVLVLWVIGSVAVAGVAPSTPGQVLYTGSFIAGDLTWQTDANGNVFPVLTGTQANPQPGRPRLPRRSLLLLVPGDRVVASVAIEPRATHRLRAGGRLAIQAALVTDTGVAVTGETAPAPDAFPAPWGVSGGAHLWRGYQLLAVNVAPLRVVQNGDAPELEFLDDYAVRVVYGNGGGPEAIQRERLVPGEAEANRQVLARLVDNPAEVDGYARRDGVAVAVPAGGFQPDKTPSLSGSPVSCLIITNQALAPSFEVLAQFRTAQGVPTLVTTREYIAANFRNGADIQETIRMFIQDSYAKWGIDYVLLGGDSDILPPRYIYNSFYPPNSYTAIPCDLYFACLDGNWNADGDANYGQPARWYAPGDNVDFAEEVYLGRAPVSTVAAADLFVNKVITYESTVAGTAWPNRALFAAEVLFPENYHAGDTIQMDGAQFADQQVSGLITPCTNMQYLRMYETDALYPRDRPLTRATLIDSLNTGHYGIVNQIGHGYFFNMSVGDANFMTSDADNLVNGNHQFVLYSLNCASAAFDNSCLMERFIQNPQGGAVCTVGSAREAFPTVVNLYQQGFFNNLYCLGENDVGRLVALSRLPYVGLTGDNYYDRWTFENYTLLGDPVLSLWSGSPRVATVTAPASIAVGQQTVAVTVTAGGAAVSGARVCLAKTGDDLTWGLTNAAGQVSLPFLGTGAGSATLTVTGRNLARVARIIPVTVSGRYLKVVTMPFVDNGTVGSLGNGNGVLDAGERIAFTPTYLNSGTAAATTLRSSISTTTPGVTVVTANVQLNNAAAGAATVARTPILVDFASTLADGQAITFLVDVWSGTTHWYSEATVVIKAPQPEVASLDWQDTTFGNGNGILESGERVALTVELKNFGVGVSGSLNGRLRSSSPNVVLRDTVCTWTSVGLLGRVAGSAPLSLALTDTAVAGPAWLLITDSYGRRVRHDFTLRRPVVPAGIETSTELGPDVIALSWHPSASADVYGYNVYRSPSAGGPFTRVNADVIAGVSYYADTGLPLLTRFYYQIAAVDSSRVPSALSPVISQSTAPAEQPGFPAAFASETSGPLAVGDVDGNGDLEIVLASSQVYVWHHDGTELRDGDNQSQTLGPFTNFPSGTLLELAAVTLADLDNQPGLEMIVSERAPNSLIHIFKADGGELPGWPRSLNTPATSTFNWTAPAVGDIDGDHQPEIVVNSLNGVVWAWNADGTEVRDGDGDPATTGVLYVRPGAQWEWTRSGPSLYDVDGDGAKEIIFGTMNDASGLKRLMAIRWDGTNAPGFPYVTSGGINGDVAIGDLDRDGRAEIVFYDYSRRLYALRTDGTNYPGFPILTPYTASSAWSTSPGLGDLDGDGYLEIVYTPNSTGLASRLVVVSTNVAAGTSGRATVKAGWPVNLPGSAEGSPVIGDLDGDGVPEIVQGIGGGDVAAPYNLYVYHANGQPMEGFPITLAGPLRPVPTITDLDQDASVDLVYGGCDFRVHVWDLPFAYNAANMPWPTFKGNMRRDGVISLPWVSAVDGATVPAASLALGLPYPNPFNPSVSVRLYVASTREVSLDVYDLRGRRVRTLHQGAMAAGWRTIVWDGRDDEGRGAASGVYFLKAAGPDLDAVTRKIVMLK